MRTALMTVLVALLAPPAAAQPLGGEQPLLRELAAAVSPERQRATIGKLV